MDAKHLSDTGFICHLLMAGDSGEEGGSVIMYLHGNNLVW